MNDQTLTYLQSSFLLTYIGTSIILCTIALVNGTSLNSCPDNSNINKLIASVWTSYVKGLRKK